MLLCVRLPTSRTLPLNPHSQSLGLTPSRCGGPDVPECTACLQHSLLLDLGAQAQSHAPPPPPPQDASNIPFSPDCRCADLPPALHAAASPAQPPRLSAGAAQHTPAAGSPCGPPGWLALPPLPPRAPPALSTQQQAVSRHTVDKLLRTCTIEAVSGDEGSHEAKAIGTIQDGPSNRGRSCKGGYLVYSAKHCMCTGIFAQEMYLLHSRIKLDGLQASQSEKLNRIATLNLASLD